MTDLLSKTITLSPDVLFQEIDGEAVLLNLSNERYYGLDEVGLRIWQLLKEGKQAQEIIPALLEEYQVDNDILTADVLQFLNRLENAGLLVIESH